MDKEITLKYSNDDITVLWKKHLCTHSKHCWQELGTVFKPTERPWVQMDGAATDAIIVQVSRCPSGALSYIKKEETD